MIKQITENIPPQKSFTQLGKFQSNSTAYLCCSSTSGTKANVGQHSLFETLQSSITLTVCPFITFFTHLLSLPRRLCIFFLVCMKTTHPPSLYLLESLSVSSPTAPSSPSVLFLPFSIWTHPLLLLYPLHYPPSFFFSPITAASFFLSQFLFSCRNLSSP